MNNKNSSNSLDFFIVDSPESQTNSSNQNAYQDLSPNQSINKTESRSNQEQNKIPEIFSSEINENLIDCTVSLEPDNQKNLEPIKEKISLSSQEYEQIRSFFQASSERRISQKTKKQELRTAVILEKIKTKEEKEPSGKISFLMENQITFSEENLKWYYINTATFEVGTVRNNQASQDRQYQEIPEIINFFLPKYSWLLELWLSNQTHSFSVKRFNQNNETGKPVYQISFGLSNQNFIEAEAPSKESCLVAVAEDLLSQINN